MKRLKISWEVVRRLLFVLFILVAAFVFAMFQGGFVSWFIFYTLLPFTLYSILFVFVPISKFEVDRYIHTAQVRNGGQLKATIHIERPNRFPLLYTVLREVTASEVLQKHGYRRLRGLRFIGFQKEVEWTYQIDQMPRGEHVLEGVEIEVSDFFGWVKKSFIYPMKQTIMVFPNVTDMMYVPIETRYDQGAAASPFTVVKDTTMATGVRDYQTGDRVSWIHWKSFAKTQNLRTKEFEDRQSQDLFLVLDRSPSGAFEEQVELVASILHAVVRNQASAAFLSLGATRSYTAPVQTDEQLQRIMFHLAKVKPDLEKRVEDVVTKESSFSQARSILLVTGELTNAWIESIPRAAKHLQQLTCFVVVKRGHKISKQQQTIHQVAKARGISVQVVDQSHFANAFTEVAMR